MRPNNGLMFRAVSTDDEEMRPSRLFSLLRRKPAQPAASVITRIDVRPPAVWGQAEPVWLALWHWLRDSDEPDRRALNLLDDARRDFCAALGDLDSAVASDLLRRAEHARSLRELWHLRAELYSVVARHLSQPEADRRLVQVNRHFPVSTPGGRAFTHRSDHEQDHTA